MSDTAKQLRKLGDRIDDQHSFCDVPPDAVLCRDAANELDRLRAELDVINKSHADLAHRLADCGRENQQLRGTLEYIAGYVDRMQDQLRQKLMNQSTNPGSSTSQDS